MESYRFSNKHRWCVLLQILLIAWAFLLGVLRPDGTIVLPDIALIAITFFPLSLNSIGTPLLIKRHKWLGYGFFGVNVTAIFVFILTALSTLITFETAMNNDILFWLFMLDLPGFRDIVKILTQICAGCLVCSLVGFSFAIPTTFFPFWRQHKKWLPFRWSRKMTLACSLGVLGMLIFAHWFLSTCAYTAVPKGFTDQTDCPNYRGDLSIDFRPNPASPSEVFIPANIAGAIHELQKGIPREFQRALKADPEECLGRYHLTAGLYIRKVWKLWGHSPLAEFFIAQNIRHADAMSSIILHSFWRTLNAQPIHLQTQIREIQAYSKRQERKERYWQEMERRKMERLHKET